MSEGACPRAQQCASAETPLNFLAPALLRTIHFILRSTRALACPNGRPARWFSRGRSPSRLAKNNIRCVPRGRVTPHAGRVCSLFQLHHSGLLRLLLRPRTGALQRLEEKSDLALELAGWHLRHYFLRVAERPNLLHKRIDQEIKWPNICG